MTDNDMFRRKSKREDDRECEPCRPPGPFKRRVIHVSSCGVANTSDTQCDFMTTALCDDGSVWILHDYGNGVGWQRLQDIPDVEVEK